MLKKTLLLLSLISVLYSFGQKRIIDHTVYDSWKTLSQQKISNDGSFILYEINPHRGDGSLYLYNTDSEKEMTFERGKQAAINYNESILGFIIDPGYDTIRQLKLEKVKKDKWVKDTLGIYWTQNDSLVKVPNVLSFKIPKEGNKIAYLVDKESLKPKEDPKKKRKKKKKKEVEIESKGNTLFIIDPISGEKKCFEYVSSYEFNKNGDFLVFVSHKTIDKKDVYQIHLYDFKEKEGHDFSTEFYKIESKLFNDEGNQFAFMASTDTSKETRLYNVYSWDVNKEMPTVLFDDTRADVANSLTVSPKSTLRFSKDGSRLFFGLYDKPEEEPKDTLLDTEKAKLDIWHYQDKRLQPQQLKELKKDQDKSLLTVLHLNDNKLVQLESDTLNVSLLDKGNSDYAYAWSREPYAAEYNWSYPWKRDIYKVDLKDGSNTLIKSGVGHSHGFSPEGTRFIYFKEGNYYAVDTENMNEICMTCDAETIKWEEDINGMIFEPGAEGTPGYLSDDEILLYSEFDIWKYNFTNNELSSISENLGAKNKWKIRLVRLERDSTYIDLNKTFALAIDQENMDEMIYSFSPFKQIHKESNKIYGFTKAKNSDNLIFRSMNVKDYPELYSTDIAFNNIQKISETNPQAEDYIWPTVEMINWESYNGDDLKGLIYKPEDFDSSKSYPLMVYFYEKYSDRKNQHYTPRPTASIIFPTEYASAGYVVFIPDIHYQEGRPGKSAYDCIMSGTDKVLELYPNIDSTRMGLQGQSWGGYQTAHLITVTNRYKVAMAGAPVSNMFSAYGGIRWASGLNRMFQYEHTQSRIGATIWEKPELYVENSPIFRIPAIETPLLIMHNDDDGAVPWYQGIEMFTAMKRLGKPVWMLSYNGDAHNLMKNANRVDLSIRMRQFFDYYLQGKPAPKWLKEGLPATEKGKEYRLELIEDE